MACSTEYVADSGLEDSATVPVAELAQPVKAAMLAAVRAASVAKLRFLLAITSVPLLLECKQANPNT